MIRGARGFLAFLLAVLLGAQAPAQALAAALTRVAPGASAPAAVALPALGAPGLLQETGAPLAAGLSALATPSVAGPEVSLPNAAGIEPAALSVAADVRSLPAVEDAPSAASITRLPGGAALTGSTEGLIARPALSREAAVAPTPRAQAAPAVARLSAGVAPLNAALAGSDALQGEHALSAFYSNAGEHPAESAAAEVGAAAPAASGLASAAAPSESAPSEPAAPTAAPETGKVTKAFKIGFIAFSILSVIEVGVTQAATLLGYHFHSNYALPGMGTGDGSMGIGMAIWLALTAVIMAPLGEEVLFRGVIMGELSYWWQTPARFFRWLNPQGRIGKAVGGFFQWLSRAGGYLVPALLSSLIFVAGHETSDPVLFGVRMIQAMGLAYLYAKRGILTSMMMHAVNNGFAMAGTFLAMLLGSGVWGDLGELALTALSVIFAIRFWRDLGLGRKAADGEPAAPGWRARVAGVFSGLGRGFRDLIGAEKTPGETKLEAREAVVMAAILLACVAYLSINSLFLVNNILMAGLPAVGLLIYAAVRARSRRLAELGLPPMKGAAGPGYTLEGGLAARRFFMIELGMLPGILAFAAFGLQVVPAFLIATLILAVLASPGRGRSGEAAERWVWLVGGMALGGLAMAGVVAAVALIGPEQVKLWFRQMKETADAMRQ